MTIFRSFYKASDLVKAHAECATVGATLMPLGKLRYFRPDYENIKDIAWKNYGWFRICAKKTGSKTSFMKLIG